MIDPRELRIGNLANTAVGLIRIEEIPLKSNPLYNPRALHPIILSEHWLERMGFSKTDGDVDYEWIHMEWSLKLWSADKSFYHINSETLTHFSSVHSLQNYFFAVTGGKELEIKP